MTQDYYGTKKVTAWPEQKPSKENPDLLLDGYAVKYADGYISWSPKEVFEEAYVPISVIEANNGSYTQRVGDATVTYSVPIDQQPV